MIQVTSPGLPLWPPLWFDPATKRAVVRIRCATWRSYELAYKVTEVCVIANLLVCLVISWKLTTEWEFTFYRLIAVAVIWVVLGTMISRWMRYALPGVLSRQFLTSKTSLWFTEESIGFRSKLYCNGVVFPKTWNSVPVELRFTIDEDRRAACELANAQPDRKAPKFHLQDARRLNVIVSRGVAEGEMPTESGAVLKAIPVCEAFSNEADKIAVVCNAAQSLTQLESHAKQKPIFGVDIDAH